MQKEKKREEENWKVERGELQEAEVLAERGKSIRIWISLSEEGKSREELESKYTVERILMRKKPTITREDRGEVKAKGGKGRKAIF